MVILALMGGSVNLTRRLPEYQVRAGEDYIATEKEPKLSHRQLREYLVFQIAQYLSAPLIAILAYYLIEPADLVKSVVLAFTAGFASESILGMVRAVADKITPATSGTTTAQVGTITGVVTLSDGKTVKGATVSLAAQPNLGATTDESGHYVLSNVPLGDQGVKAVFQQDPQHKLEKSETVRIDRPQSVVTGNIKFA
jgi:hypothetical protein